MRPCVSESMWAPITKYRKLGSLTTERVANKTVT